MYRVRVYGLALCAAAVMTLCAVWLRNTLTLANFTMVYLLLVVVIAVWAGTGAAFVTTFVSFACINYFLVPPYYTFLVSDPREVLDLIVFLIVASIAARLASDARERAQEARQRAREQEILYRLTRSFNQQTQIQGVYDALTRVLQDDLSASTVSILPYASEAMPHGQSVHYVLLQSSERIYGTVCISFAEPLTEIQIQLLHTCVSQAAMALQRIDLTERASKSRQFEDADKLKTAILHAVSHDLRTPITIIKTSASNLRQFHDQLTREEEVEIAETIEHEIDQLDKLVGNLLDMSRLNAGALALNSQLNALEEIAGDVAARVWKLTGQERITIHFPDEMPLVNLDYGLMLQAVTNLVENSLRYEPPTSQIAIRGRFTPKHAIMEIVNHGETISQEVKDRMMTPFYHGSGGRLGLGLPIAKGIIEAHHGQLSVEDTPKGGATFVIQLPLDEAHGQ